jgi:hypothetical protein
MQPHYRRYYSRYPYSLDYIAKERSSGDNRNETENVPYSGGTRDQLSRSLPWTEEE